MKRLVKYSEYFGRMGELDGLFVVDGDDWELLERLIKEKQTIYFGEVLGKHSEIYGTLSDTTIEVKSENQEFCNEFDRLGLGTGFNPLHYYEEQEEE